VSAAPQSVLVVGASLAGLSTARALRSQGFTGSLTIVGDELHRPYDRPPLSKEFLSSPEDRVDLALEAEGEELDATWRLGARAIGLRPLPHGGAQVELRGGEAVCGDGVVIATGASARCTLPGVGLPGVHLLRTLDDAQALRSDLHHAVAHDRPVVVVGGGFIGSEVAATARALGCRVTLVVPDDVPLRAALGPYADAIAALHAAHGVTVRPRARVAGVRPSAGGLEVLLVDGPPVPAATVVLGIGAAPSVGWLAGSGLDLGPDGTGAVRCDEGGATGLDGVYAVGDCAAWHSPGHGYHHQVEHWTSAKERGALVAARLLGVERLPACRPPYVWSDLYGKKLQLAGYRDLADHPATVERTLETGSVADGSFTAVYRRGGEPVAVLALDQPRPFAAVRRRLLNPLPALVEGAPA
jgi:3-phenylpropionate/trans-cinnamate dioxygenase ferredoxin reductase component